MWKFVDNNDKIDVYQNSVHLFSITNINHTYWRSVKPILELSPDLFSLFSKVLKRKQENNNM